MRLAGTIDLSVSLDLPEKSLVLTQRGRLSIVVVGVGGVCLM